MYELLKVETMCGICCLSMKTVVVMDLIVTMILPASLAYVVYLTYLFVTEPESIDMFIIIFYGITFGMQMVSFLIRSRWDYLWWFFVFTFVGIPVFYFLLPIYAFTNMDDFSWGKTRTVAGGDEGKQKSGGDGKSKRFDSKADLLPEEAVSKRQGGSVSGTSQSKKLSRSTRDSQTGSTRGPKGDASIASGTNSAVSGGPSGAPSVISGLTGFTDGSGFVGSSSVKESKEKLQECKVEL